MRKLGEIKDTAVAYGSTLVELGRTHPEIVVIEADLMKASGSAPFKEAFPDRIYNVGVAEQNSLSFAAGFASMGKTPYVSGFACFIAQRACDQAVNSIGYNKFNVKVIGTYAGLTSEKNGGTHISVADVSIYRTIPNFVVVDPGDANEFSAVMKFAAGYDGPMYIRSNKGKYPTFLSDDYKFALGRSTILSDGEDVGLITSGITTLEGIFAVEDLSAYGITIRHVHMSSIKPIDKEELVRTAKKTKLIITVENHSVIGGLGSAVSEVLGELYPTKIIRLGLQDHFGETADLAYMMHKYGIDSESISFAVCANRR